MLVTPAQISAKLDQLGQRKKAYQGIPPDVMDDLAEFCRATKTCFHADPRSHALLEGRREVYLRIQQHLDHSPEELLKLYSNNEYSIDDLQGTEYAR